MGGNGTATSAKKTAYMCDPANWIRYKTGMAQYAVGGPTSEMIIASRYNVQVDDFKTPGYNGDGKAIISNLSTDGYGNAAGDPNPYPSGYTPKLSGYPWLTVGYPYWLASPFGSSSSMDSVWADGYINSWSNSDSSKLRPTVCLPIYALEIVDNGGTKTLKIAD